MPTKSVIIQGTAFEIEQPYAEGHTLTAVEANVLNQTRNENIRNNLAKVVREHEGSDAELAAKVAEYDSQYTFSTPSAGGTRVVRDPVEKEARRLAKEALRAHLKAEHGGLTFKDLGAEKVEEYVSQLSAREDILKLAKKNVKAASDISSISLDNLQVPQAAA